MLPRLSPCLPHCTSPLSDTLLSPVGHVSTRCGRASRMGSLRPHVHLPVNSPRAENGLYIFKWLAKIKEEYFMLCEHSMKFRACCPK